MATLLELKEKFRKIFAKYNAYIVPAAKFLITLISLLMLNSSIGYMSKLKNPLIAILISIICAFVPSGFMVVCISAVMVIHLYSISAEFALITLCMVMIMYLLYFRLASRTGYLILITAMLCFINMPYLAPIAFGLTIGLAAIVPTGFGVIIYYVIKTASIYEAALTGETASSSVQKFTYIIESFLNNKDMIVIFIAVVATIIAVSIIRKAAIQNAWSVAIILGAIIEFVIIVVGKLALSAGLNIILAIFGILVSMVIAYICQICFFNLDYKRTEVVQYEDDEYYYYVKAVPKISIVSENVRVKKINAQKTRRTDDISNSSGNNTGVASSEHVSMITNAHPLNEANDGSYSGTEGASVARVPADRANPRNAGNSANRNSSNRNNSNRNSSNRNNSNNSNRNNSNRNNSNRNNSN